MVSQSEVKKDVASTLKPNYVQPGSKPIQMGINPMFGMGMPPMNPMLLDFHMKAMHAAQLNSLQGSNKKMPPPIMPGMLA